MFMYVSVCRAKVRCRVVPDVGVYVSGIRSDAGASSRNVCMFDILGILGCVCFNVSGLRSDVGANPRNVYMLMLCV